MTTIRCMYFPDTRNKRIRIFRYVLLACHTWHIRTHLSRLGSWLNVRHTFCRVSTGLSAECVSTLWTSATSGSRRVLNYRRKIIILNRSNCLEAVKPMHKKKRAQMSSVTNPTSSRYLWSHHCGPKGGGNQAKQTKYDSNSGGSPRIHVFGFHKTSSKTSAFRL